MTTPIRCVVLDIDDTLYLERDYVRSGFAAVGDGLGSSSFAATAWQIFVDGGRGNIFDRALAALGLPAGPGEIARCVSLYRSHLPAISLLPDAAACIQHWSKQARLAAVTDGPAPSQRAKATALGLETWCSPLVVTAELGPGFSKPHPRPFLQVQEATGEQGAACIYIADNPHKDFVSPRELGWRTLRVRREGGLHEDVPSGDDVDWEIPNMDAGPSALQELLPWP